MTHDELVKLQADVAAFVLRWNDLEADAARYRATLLELHRQLADKSRQQQELMDYLVREIQPRIVDALGIVDSADWWKNGGHSDGDV